MATAAPTLRSPLRTPTRRPRPSLATLGPNWFASVMGTGIVAVAATLLPHRGAALHALALGAWGLASTLLIALLLATAVQWWQHPAAARAHASDPVMAPFYGAPAMALLTVGASTLLVGREVVGDDAALVVALALWTLGTLAGLATAVGVPYLMFTRHELKLEATAAAWLMPVVPPMVSAATAAALIGHLPAGQARLDLLLAAYAMFGLSLVATLVILPLLWGRLAYHGVGEAGLVPTLWIVLGPFGQSITAACLLGAAAPGVIPAPYAGALQALGVVFGVPAFGFAMLWLVLAAAITLRTARSGLPFSLTWWSFTFPVGTTVTGTSLLAERTGSVALGWLAVTLFGLLVTAWCVAGVNTLRALHAGRLLAPPAPGGAQPASLACCAAS